jgi:hypothetical protein
MVNVQKYQLERYAGRRTRHTCPGCGKPYQFTRYIDADTGQHIAPHVGKCNRLEKCGYHYPPRLYFAEHPESRGAADQWRETDIWQTTYTPPPVDYLPAELLAASQKQFENNNFCRYLAKLFGWEKTLELAATYKIGTSKHWEYAGGYSVAFWQIDRAGNIRQCKVMAYDPHTGRRIQDGGSKIAFLGKQIAGKDANLAQCFFGEHLVTERPDAPVCIVESEKTAIICAGYAPGAVWLATGGKNGCRWADKSVYSALEGRQATLYPDLGAYDVWADKAKLLATVCDVAVSDLLERRATAEQRAEGYDLADLLTDSAAAQVQAKAAGKQPQSAPQAQESATASQAPAQGQGSAHSAPQQAQWLPDGFAIVGDVIEIDGLPWEWLNDEEVSAAQDRAKGFELAIFERINPAVKELAARFGLTA